MSIKVVELFAGVGVEEFVTKIVKSPFIYRFEVVKTVISF